MQSDDQKNMVDSIREYVIAGVETKNINGVPVSVIPENAVLHLHEDLMEQPQRISQRIEAESVEGFVDYYNKFATDNSVIFANVDNRCLKAILDYHTAHDDPQWCRHQLTYSMRMAPDMASWIRFCKEFHTQDDFATFMEEHARDFTTPTASTMLSIAYTFEAKGEMTFRRATNLDNGAVQFTYDQTINGQAGPSGQLEIPREVAIELQPFEGADPVTFPGRFRYRLREGVLRMRIELDRADQVLEDAARMQFAEVSKGVTKGQMLHCWPRGL